MTASDFSGLAALVKVGSGRPRSNQRNSVTLGQDNLKRWGDTASCPVNGENCVFQMSISWDIFAVSKDVMLFLYPFPTLWLSQYEN